MHAGSTGCPSCADGLQPSLPGARVVDSTADCQAARAFGSGPVGDVVQDRWQKFPL